MQLNRQMESIGLCMENRDSRPLCSSSDVIVISPAAPKICIPELPSSHYILVRGTASQARPILIDL